MILTRLKEKYGDKKVLLTSSDFTGCGLMRSIYPFNFLRESFEWCHHSSGFPPNNPVIYEADVVVLQRPHNEFFLKYIPEMQSRGKHVIIDLDDTLWDIPTSNHAHKYYNGKALKEVDSVFKLASCITTSTIPLHDLLLNRFNKKTFVIPNHLWHNEIFIEGEKEKNSTIKIGWAGSYTHLGDFDHHLVNVLRDLPKDKCTFYSMGFTPQFFKNFAISLPWIETIKFHQAFRDINFDIGIMVAENNTFNKCKSNLKYLEYGATKTAAIGHAVYPYTTTIEHGVDGFLVENPKTDWKKYIYQLIEDEPFRLEMANKAHQKVLHEYTYEMDCERLEQKYLDIFDYLYKGELTMGT